MYVCMYVGESIRSLECGVVNTPEFDEVTISISFQLHSLILSYFLVQKIIVAAYSGKIISFTTEPVHFRAQVRSFGVYFIISNVT